MYSREADRLLAQVTSDPWGRVSASPYETARLAALAPWLPGHEARLSYLCQSQHPDGSWGGPEGYALVPTLSATAALLAQLPRAPGRGRCERAASAGLRALHRWLAPGRSPLVPDTIASELVVPALIAEVNRRSAVSGQPPLRLPAGFSEQPLARATAGMAAGVLPRGLAYSLEVFGAAAVACPLVRPAGGAVGLSPAATAAWLGGPSGHRAGYEFLDRLQARGAGPVPVVTPITYFEAAWVLNSLSLGGLTASVPSALLDRLAAGLTERGAPVAPGLPPDSDDTGVVLAALFRHGRVCSPESLLGFHADGYFRCYHGERDPSVSANAHALEALTLYLAGHPGTRTRFGAAATATAEWLLSIQQPDGSWWDKWHASPYYATAACVLALAQHGGPGTPEAVARAVAWVRDTERPDGSWGRWRGTVEETAYAVQILSRAPAGSEVTGCLTRAAAYLTHPAHAEHPPLWHGKDLYTPLLVVRASHLGARMLATRLVGGAARVPAQRRGSAQVGTPVEADRAP